MSVLCAMGPPGGARSPLSQRFQRHFNLLTYIDLEDSSVNLIFNTIVKNLLHKFPEEVKDQIQNIILCTLNLYKEIRINMLPTPKKAHYIFNIRDMSKTLGGVCSASIKYVLSKTDIVRLYMHECIRVFGDRFTNEEDNNWLVERLNKNATEVFSEKLEDIYKFGKKIIFCDFLYGDAFTRNYAQVNNSDDFINKINGFLENYNETTKKKQLKLVMFLDACDHVSRICRIIRSPQGNALLLGVGGSGRQSLARLASFINTYETYQIEVIKGYSMNEFNKNVKECLKDAGIKQNPITFLIADTQLVFPLQLEYINNILNSGDVPNIYKRDDLDEITSCVRNEVLMKYGNLQESNVMKTYIQRVLKNIHVVIAMSPVSNSFQSNLRMFPSLVNCCTLDWFTDWPEDALESVANDSLRRDTSSTTDSESLQKVVEAFKFIHKKVETESKEFSNQMKRYIYLTPTSYLELLNLYQKILNQKRKEIFNQINRFENGLKVLKEAGIEVNIMSNKIAEKKPILEINKQKTKELVEVLKVEKAKADEDEREAIIKTESASKFEADCKIILDEANFQLELVRPLIKEAVESVNKVKKNDLEVIKGFKTMSKSVELLLEGLLIFKLGNSWRTKEYLVKNQLPDKNPYNIKEALTKKVNFGELKNMCSEENLKIFKVTHFENMKILDEFFKTNGVDRQKCEGGAKDIIGLFEFMEKIIKYVDDSVNKIDPILVKLDTAKVEMQVAVQTKEEALAKKMKAEKIVKTLNEQYECEMKKEKDLQDELDQSELKLERANNLIDLLSGEQSRWEENVRDLKLRLNNLTGDCLIAAGSISYCGPFTYMYRMRLESAWRKKIKELGIIHTPEISMKELLEDKVEVRDWSVNGLPQDNLSIENATIMKYSRRWPLIVDPQNQGSSFIKKFGKRKDNIEVVKASDATFLNVIIGCIRNSKQVLLENVGIDLDPSLDPILNQQIIEKAGGSKEITIGNATIQWSDKFKLYISTTIPNPHYSPETFVKVTIINFGITPTGLEEQMMTLLINNEMPELEQRKNAILIENFNSMNDLRETEDKILSSLSGGENSGGGSNIAEFLNSDNLILTLKDAKTKSEEISQKLKESEETSKQIDLRRELYRPAALRASLLFFATIDLSSIDPMYQFSLQWFAKLYENSIKITPPSNSVDTRISNINKKFTYILFENVCRSLFEKDKLLFSFVICHKIITGDIVKEPKNKIDPDEWRYLLAGPLGDMEVPNNPTTWISKNYWINFYRQLHFMSDNFETTKDLEKFFFDNHDKFKKLYDNPNIASDLFPDPWQDQLTDFMRLAIIKMIRPDKFINALQLWIEKNLGKEFIEGTAFSLPKTFKESSNIVPLIFILSPGSDPINDIKNFAEEMGYAKRFDFVSLGRGQEKKALDRLDDMRTKGGWVLLQNCHLAKSFMGKLEEIVENFDTNWPDKDFRLWLTSMSNDKFPVSILQNSLKITVEPPKGLKNNLMRTYNKLENKDLEDCEKKNEYKTLIFGLSFFHAILQDRRKYGPIGWNVKYDFTNEDWMVCRKQLKIFLEDTKDIPYQVLEYLIGDVNYGGRVTDDKDQRLIKTILKTYFTDKVLRKLLIKI
jgi:dynein heavy chain